MVFAGRCGRQDSSAAGGGHGSNGAKETGAGRGDERGGSPMRGDGARGEARGEVSFGWGDQADKAAVLRKGDAVSFAVAIDRPTRTRSGPVVRYLPVRLPKQGAPVLLARQPCRSLDPG